MTAIIESAAAQSIATLATHVFQRLHRRYSLPMRMGRALNADEPDPQEHTLLEALTRTFGARGTLTTTTHKALLDIANSGLLDQLLPLVASDLDHTPAKDIATYVHMSRGSTDFSLSTQFAAELITCLRIASQLHNSAVLEHLPPVPANRFRRDSLEEARRAASLLASLVLSLKDKSGNWLTDTDLSPYNIAKLLTNHSDPLRAYAKLTLKSVESIDIHGISDDVLQVALDDIYVDVPVTLIPRRSNFIEYQDLRVNLPRHTVSSTWKDTLDHVSRTVLLGDPGGGKSTLSKKLCYEHAKQFLEGHSTLPVFVQLRTYIAKAVDDELFSLRRYVLEHIESVAVDADRRALRSAVLYHLNVGSVFLVADGLDEVLTPSNRARVVREIKALCDEWPLATVLVTSRYVGYEIHPIKDFNHLGIDHLNEEAVEAIYENVSGAVLQKRASEIQRTKRAFLIDAKAKAAELIRNPLLLTLIAIIYHKKSEIPDNRAALYSFCAELLFERWDAYRKITPELPERFRLFDLFMHLSSILYENEKYGGRINRPDLVTEARLFFRKDYIDNKEGKSAAAAHHMVVHLTGRAWILQEVGEDVFEFTHRTFLEFFYARYLETEYETTEALVEECLRHVEEGSRTVPAHLALQIRTKDKRSASTKVSDLLTQVLQKKGGNFQLVDFCLDALGYLLPEGESISMLVSALAPRVLPWEGARGQIRLLCTENPMRNTILQAAMPAINQVRSVDGVRKLAPALYRLRAAHNSDVEVVGGGKVDIVAMVVERNFAKQSSSPYLCKLAFDLDQRVNWEALEKFGLRVWINKWSGSGFQLFSDSRRMAEAMSRVACGNGMEGERYGQLAQVVCRERIWGGVGQRVSYGLGRVMRDGRFAARASVCGDKKVWVRDGLVLEVFAISFALFLEMNGEDSRPDDLRYYKRILDDLVEVLGEVNPSRAAWLEKWIAGGVSIVSDLRQARRRGELFS